MKKILLLLLAIAVLQVQGQDTTRVQTFTFDDITKRRGWFEFPSEGDSYRKIMMNYTLKCDAATQQDNFQCGEWDYTTYTDLYTYDNVGTPYFRLGTQTLDSIPYVSEPIYDTYQYEQTSGFYLPVIGETESPWGDDQLDEGQVIRADRFNHRAQYIYPAADLGLSTNEIDKMAINVVSTEGEVEWLTIRLGHTLLTDLDEGSVIDEGLQTVYQYNTAFMDGAWQVLHFPTPFEYDGSSNLLVDISMHSADPSGGATVLRATDMGEPNGLVSTSEDRYLDFGTDQYVEIPVSAFDEVDQELSLSFWAYGDEETMPFNSWVLEGVDDENRRVVNVHLPWSNSRVYWDAGNEGTTSYDRIDIEVDIAELAGKWTHWAFTKNATTGDMAIYMNGQLIHSGTGLTRSMAGIERFKLGGRADQAFSGNWDGHIDEFQIWNKALSEDEIMTHMFSSIEDTHPQYGFLQAAYDFDEASGQVAVDYSGQGRDAVLMGVPNRVSKNASELILNMESTSVRPDIILYQNSGTASLSTQIVEELVAHPLHSVIETLPTIDTQFSGVSYEYIDTSYVYLPAEALTYDINGDVIESETIGATDVFYNSFKQNRHQLQNYVTPYGIGLSLGPQGFRWEYEVTDYALLFDGLVEIAAGNQQELIDLEFVMIEGTPPRDPLAFETIWLGDYQHTDIADDVVMPAVEKTLRPDASDFMLRTRTTGHWFGGFNNCAEFCPKNFNLSIDGTQQFEWLNWKECADNPVIDQGGTWIYDRAGWCPGTFADSYDHEVTDLVTAGGTHSIDFGMEPYPSQGGEGNYRTTLQLFQFGAKNFQHDVEVSEIISPNAWEFQNRYNPICKDPEIEVRNLGSEVITSMDITYWVEGGTPETFAWSGQLDFMERARVTLPISGQTFWDGSGEAEFYVSVGNPNGVADEHADNDQMSAEFEWPEVVAEPFFIWFKSNGVPSENEYTLYNEQGDVVFSRDEFEPNTTYRDTLYLDDGCYVLRFEDTGEDGLSFFANNDGSGYFRLRYVSGSVLEYFNPNFGSFLNFQFVVDSSVSLDESLDEDLISVSPNPSNGRYTLNIDGYEGSTVQVEVLDARGTTVYSLLDLSTEDQGRHELDLTAMSDGIYFVRILIDGRQIIRKVIKE